MIDTDAATNSDSVSPTGTPSFELDSGADTREETWPAPRIHGVTAQVLYQNDPHTALLYNLLADWYQQASNTQDSPLTIPAHSVPDIAPSREYVWKVSASNWLAGTVTNGEYQPKQKYNITLRRREDTAGGESLAKPAVSCALTVTPQVPGLQQSNGASHPTPYGIGTRVRIQTSFPKSQSEIVTRLVKALRDILPASAQDLVDPAQIDATSKRLLRVEVYHRIDTEEKHPLLKTIEQSVDLVDVDGDSTISHRKKRQPNGWVDHRTKTNEWYRLGITEADFERTLKIYHAPDWKGMDSENPRRHPKLEARYHGGDDRSPHFDEWATIVRRLRELVIVHASYAGIDREDLITDAYFDPATQPSCTVGIPTGRREDLRRYYDNLRVHVFTEAVDESGALYDILSLLCERSRGYEELADATGYTVSNIRYHVGRLADWGVVKRIGNPTIVRFAANYLREQIEDLIDNKIAPHFGEVTQRERREGRAKRARNRREKREDGESPGTDTDQESSEVGDDG